MTILRHIGDDEESASLHFTSLHFLKAPKTGQRTPAALSDSYTGPYIEKKAHRALLVTT